MTEQTEVPTTPVDVAKAIVAGVLALGGVVAYHVFATQPGWARALMVLAGLVLAVLSFVSSAYAGALTRFVAGARIELRKMVWPTVPETRQTTLLVFVFVVVLGLFFWLVDTALGFATRSLLGQG